MNEISNLPSHPLLVHAAVVLVPILAVITIALAIRPGWRLRFGIPITVINFLMLGYVSALVMDSGEFLAEKVQLTKAIDKHEELAEFTRLLMAAMFLGLLALVIIDRLRPRASDGTGARTWAGPLSMVMSAATIVVAVLSVVWMIRTGHEGARVTWQGIPGIG